MNFKVIPNFMILIILSVTSTIAERVTVDDTFPDPLTKKLYFTPRSKHGSLDHLALIVLKARVKVRRTCPDGTYYARQGNTTPNRVLTAEFNFTGIAVYVYCIITNSKDHPASYSDMSFYVDDELAGTFIREADGSPGFIYNFPVFASSSLSDGEHKLVIQNGHRDGNTSLILLDSIIYTQDQDQQHQAGKNGGNMRKLGIILGCTMGGLGCLILGFGWLFWRRRNSDRNQNESRQQSLVEEHSVYPLNPVDPVFLGHQAPPAYRKNAFHE